MPYLAVNLTVIKTNFKCLGQSSVTNEVALRVHLFWLCKWFGRL